MTLSQNGFRLLSACLLACLCLGAYWASAAEAGGEWRIEGKTMAERGETKSSVGATAGEAFTLSIPWYASELKCNTASFKNGLILTGGTSTATWVLSSCTLVGPPFVSETCKLVEPVEINTKSSLVLHNTRTYQVFEPEKAAFVKFKEGTECPLPLSNEITGTIPGETKAAEQTKRPVVLSSTVSELLGGGIKFGGHPATLKGILNLAVPAGGEKLWTGIAGPPSEEELLHEWKLGGPTLENWEQTEAALSSSASKVLLNLESAFFRLQCSSASLDGFALKTGGTVNGTILFGTCVVFVMGVEKSQCAPKSSPTAKVKGKLVLGIEKATYVLFEPQEAGALINFSIPEFKGCFAEGELSATGSFVARCEIACGSEVSKRSLIVDAEAGKGFPSDIIKFGSKTQILQMNFDLSLAAPHAGMAWSGTP